MSYLENNLDALEMVDAPLAYRIRKSKHIDFPPRKFCGDRIEVKNKVVFCGFSSIDWLKVKKCDVEVIDDSSARLIVLLSEVDLSESIQNKEIAFTLIDQEEDLLTFSWRGLFKVKTYVGEERIIDCVRRVEDEVHTFASEYRCLGKRVLGNVKSNLLEVTAIERLQSCMGNFQGRSAIVCGSSEELFSRLAEIGECAQDVIIIAAGSSLIHLDKEGIRADFTCMVDPDLDEKSYMGIEDFSMPMFCQLRLDRRVWKMHQGRKIHIPAHGGWLFENMLCKELGLEDKPFNGGLTSGSMAIEMAHILGCTQIIVIGMEGAFRRDLADTLRRINEKTGDYNLKRLKKEDKIADYLEKKKPSLPEWKKIEIDHQRLKEILAKVSYEQSLIKKRIEMILQEEDPVILESDAICALAKFETIPFFHLHLNPLWHIFRPLYKEGDALQEIIFYKSVLEELDEKI